jgi:GAF domain-containing protein
MRTDLRHDTTTAGGREPEDVSRLRMSRDAALQAAREAMRDATRLTRLLTVLNELGSLDSLLDRALSTLSELFAAEIVVLLDPAGTGRYTPLASIGLPEDVAREPFSGHHEGYVRTTMRDGAPILITHATQDDATDIQLRELGSEAIIYLPIVASHLPRGVLILARCHSEPFSYPDIGLLTAMSHRIGLALEQAQRRQQLEQIVDAERKIGLDLEETEVACKAVRMLPALVGADGAALVTVGDDGRVTTQVTHGDVPKPHD